MRLCRMVSAAYFAHPLRKKSHERRLAHFYILSPSQYPSGYINFILPPPAAVSPSVTPFDLLMLTLRCHLMMFMKENVTRIAQEAASSPDSHS